MQLSLKILSGEVTEWLLGLSKPGLDGVLGSEESVSSFTSRAQACSISSPIFCNRMSSGFMDNGSGLANTSDMSPSPPRSSVK